MQVSQVTENDGRMCVQLINLLKHGKWDLSGGDITAHAHTVAWVHRLAQELAIQLKQSTSSTTPPAPLGVPNAIQGMRVKSQGKLKPTKKKK